MRKVLRMIEIFMFTVCDDFDCFCVEVDFDLNNFQSDAHFIRHIYLTRDFLVPFHFLSN